MSILVIAEHDCHSLKPATLHTLAAANALGGDVHLLIAGSEVTAIGQGACNLQGVSQVLIADAPALKAGLAEDLSALVLDIASHYSHILAPATSFGKNLLPRIAALLDVQPISDIIAIESPDTFSRLIYAGSLVARVQSLDATKVLSVRTTAFDPVASTGGAAQLRTLNVGTVPGLSQLIKEALAVSDRPELTAARVVISGGRGLQSADNFNLLYTLADKLGAAVGASRAAVDAGYAANDLQVGQTGKIVAPELYIAVGISGAVQHLAGMKDSKVIVAINKDPDAPIFQVADYGLVADLFEAVPAFTQGL